jgi:hypothetical protein
LSLIRFIVYRKDPNVPNLLNPELQGGKEGESEHQNNSKGQNNGDNDKMDLEEDGEGEKSDSGSDEPQRKYQRTDAAQ